MPTRKEVALNLLDEPGRPLRENISREDIYNLAQSIATIGLLSPLGVIAHDGRYEVMFGHCRLLACRLIQHTPVDIVAYDLDEAQALEQQAAENMVRRDLTPIEEAKALRTMVDIAGATMPDTAKAVGRSVAWVRGRLELLRWPPEILESIQRGELNVSVARELVMIDDEGYRKHYVRCAVESGCTAAQARLWRQDWESRFLPLAETHSAGAPLSAPVSPVEPRLSCGVCEEIFPVRATQILQVCDGCLRTLNETKAQADQ
ncbi:MAG: ParB/RepB/Spo0J family partition protein [Planctomycetota bacterium]|jgi:ParB/RepB/Spo0J family partition protein